MYIDKSKEKYNWKRQLSPKRKKNYVMCIGIPQKYIQGKIPETSVNQATLRKRKADFILSTAILKHEHAYVIFYAHITVF